MTETSTLPDENNENNRLKLMGMVSHIVAAYVSNHTVERSELPAFILQVQRNLRKRTLKGTRVLSALGTPAVPIEESITPDAIICLEDGRQMKMLKQHLKKAYNMTPDQYRERWGLPANYPMVAPNYAKQRQRIAQNTGLGTKKQKKAA